MQRRPTNAEYVEVCEALEAILDEAARRFPNPGRTEGVRRLNRSEYRNAIRDLVKLDVDVDELLPGDSSGHGFDNVTVSGLSPALLNRYIMAAEQIARQAMGRSRKGLDSRIVRLPADRTQGIAC